MSPLYVGGVPVLLLVAAAIVLDLIIGDPRWLPHPVVIMGRAISALERCWNHGSPRRRRWWGGLLTASVVLGTWLVSWLALTLLAQVSHWLALAATLWLLATTLAINGLAEAGRAVAAPLMRGDLPAARQALAMIVGRETAHLEEADITRGAVETIAENSVDGITSPLLYALIGGAPLALAYKAVNTLDSMVGYRNPRFADFGYASAKLDDVANWLPARLTALCLWGAGALLSLSGRPLRLRGALKATWQQAPRHPSPNGGWPEAMTARLLGIQLGGLNRYHGVDSHRALLGEALEPLAARHIAAAIALMHGAWLLFYLFMATLLYAGGLAW